MADLRAIKVADARSPQHIIATRLVGLSSVISFSFPPTKSSLHNFLHPNFDCIKALDNLVYLLLASRSRYKTTWIGTPHPYWFGEARTISKLLMIRLEESAGYAAS